LTAALLAVGGLTSAASAQTPALPNDPRIPRVLQKAPPPAPSQVVPGRYTEEPLLIEEEQVSEHATPPRIMLPPPGISRDPRFMNYPGLPECADDDELTPAQEVTLRCLLFTIHPLAAFIGLEIEVPATTLPSPTYLEHPPQYIAPSPDLPLLSEERVPELVGLPEEVERLDFMPAEVEVLDVMPSEESETHYELLVPWIDSTHLFRMPFFPQTEIEVGVRDQQTGAMLFGLGVELSRTGTVVVNAEAKEVLPPPRPLWDIGPRTQSLEAGQTGFGSVPTPSQSDIERYRRIGCCCCPDPAFTYEIIQGSTRLLQLRQVPFRIEVGNNDVADYVTLDEPTEFLVQGLHVGTTTMYMWFGDRNDPTNQEKLTFQVNVLPEPCKHACPVEKCKKDSTQLTYVPQVVADWDNEIVVGVDPAKRGETMHGVSGRVYLFAGSKMENVMADGRLVIEMWGINPENPLAGKVCLQPWVIDKDILNREYLNTGGIFGPCYSLKLPWPGYRPDISQVEMRLRYEPAKGIPLYDMHMVTLISGPDPKALYSWKQPAPAAPVPVGKCHYSTEQTSADKDTMRCPAKTQVQLSVLIASVDSKAARTLNLARTTGKAGPWAMEVADEVRLKSLRAGLNGLRESYRANLLAEPCLVTLSGQQVSFLSGGEVIKPVIPGIVDGVHFETCGTRLNCQPTVLADGKIRLEVEQEICELIPPYEQDANSTVRADSTSQRIHTIAEVARGHALVICGPRLNGKSRLVVIMTPTVIETAAAAPLDTRVFSKIGTALRHCLPDICPFINSYPSDPQRRMMVLMNQSENLRQIEAEMEQFWRVDQPSHLSPERLHAGLDDFDLVVSDLLVKCQREFSRGHYAGAQDLAQQAIQRNREATFAHPLVVGGLLQRVKEVASIPLGTVDPSAGKPAGTNSVPRGEGKSIGSKDRMVEALMEEFNNAFKEARYRDAETLAQRALELDPENGIAVAARNIAQTQLAALTLRQVGASPVVLPQAKPVAQYNNVRPSLPPVDPAVVGALQKILIDREKGVPFGGVEEAEPKDNDRQTPRR